MFPFFKKAAKAVAIVAGAEIIKRGAGDTYEGVKEYCKQGSSAKTIAPLSDRMPTQVREEKPLPQPLRPGG